MLKFDRYPHRPGQPVHWSVNRSRALANKPKRIAKKLEKQMPLIADQELERIKLPSEAEVIEQLQRREDATVVRRRHQRACDWIRARQWLRSLPGDTAERVLDRYNNNRFGPKDPVRLLCILDVESGEQAKRLAKIESERQERARQCRTIEQLELPE